jgi:PAS domain S-box-containing protein
MDLHPGPEKSRVPERAADSDPIRRALHENQDWYQDLVEHSQDLLCVHDLEGRILSMNPAPARVLGYSVEELLQIPMREIIAPEFRPQFDAYLNQIARVGESRGLMTVLTRSGERRLWEYHNTLRREGVATPIVRGMARDVTEQRETEKRLREVSELLLSKVRESEHAIRELKLFRTLVDHCNDAIEVVDPETLRFLDVNEKACSELGYSREELLSMRVFDIDPVVTEASAAKALEKLRNSGSLVMDSLHRRKDGITFPVEVSMKRVQLERDYIIAISRDLSERKLAEARLRASQDRYRAVHDRSPVGICWVETATGRLLGANPKYCEIVGRTEQDLLGRTFQSITHPDDLAMNLERLRQLVEGEVRHFEMEKRYLRPDGSVRWAEVEVAAMWAEGDDPVWHMAIVQDITVRRWAEERLREYERVVEGLEEMIVVVDRDYRYVIANRAFLNNRGMEKEQIIGRSVLEQLSAEGAPEGTLELVKQKLEGCFQGKVVRYEMKYKYPKVGERDLLLSYFPIEGPTGVDRIACILTDITERKQAEEAQCRLNRELRAISNCNQTLLRAVDEQTLLNDICRIVCDEAGYYMAWVGYAQHDEAKTLRPVAWAGVEDGYLATTSVSWADTERGHGPGGTAIRSGASVYIQDFATDTQAAPWRENALQRGYRSNLAVPLKDDSGNTFGALGIYSTEPNAFTPEETRLLEGLAGDLAFGITVLRARVERKRAEEALKKSEEKFSKAFRLSPVAITLTTIKDHRYIEVNETFERLTGWRRDEVTGRTPFDIGVWVNPAERVELAKQLLTEGCLRDVEAHFRKKDGAIRVGLATAELIELNGEPCAIAAFADVTERKQAEEALRRSEENYRLFVSQSSEGIFRQDLDAPVPIDLPEDELVHHILYDSCLAECNEAIVKMYGLNSVQEFVGKRLTEMLPPEDPHNIELTRQYIRSGFRVLERESHEIDIHGNPKAFLNSLIGIVENGMLVRTWGIQRDVTEKVKLEHSRRQAEEALRQNVTELQVVTEELRLAQEKLTEEKLYLEQTIDTELGFGEIIGRSSALQEVMGKVAKVAPSDATVLLLGETGTGKELVARAIHRMSKRKDNSFVKVNCAAIPSGLLESELFGHEKGAFTGAVARKLGRLELADRGTLFLDEIGEIPLDLQPKLLRVLQDQEFERLGGTQTLKVDFRLVAATNRDLLNSVNRREFRSDLYYRLNVFPLRSPPLRERREDIPLLIEHFVRKYASRMNKSILSIPAKTMETLVQWAWPGNIRELENFVERSVILTPGPVLQVPLSELHAEPEPEESVTLHDKERERILRALRECKGQLGGPNGAAARLGLKRTTLQSKLTQLGINPGGYRA